MKKIIIIGAGPAGLSAAYTLSKSNYRVEIFEFSSQVGGMSKSFDLWGQKVDLGPHRFFSKEPKVNAFFDEIVQDDYTLVDRLTRIYYKGRFFDYPLKFFNVLKNLNLLVIIDILYHYTKQQIFPIKNPKNFEEWVVNRFGYKLYSIFFKNYTEKLWGISCTDIDSDWAAQRIKGLSLFEAVINSIIGDKNSKHKTLVDQFKYPNNGTGALYEKTEKMIVENAGTIHKEMPIKKVLVEDNVCVGVITTDNKKHFADYVISSMPLTSLIKGFNSVPNKVSLACEKLFFRNTILVYLEIERENLFEDNWIYIHSPDVRHGRITNFRNWCSSLNKDKKSTILCMEFWAFEKDKIWKSEDDFIYKLAENELKKIGLIEKSEKILNYKTIKVPRSYPVYEIGYKEHLQNIESFLNEISNLSVIGRYGSFKYNNQDHSILMGILAAENIIYDKNVDLWEINTDTNYQEDGEVTDVLIQ